MTGQKKITGAIRGYLPAIAPPLLFVVMPRFRFEGWQYIMFFIYFFATGVFYFFASRHVEPFSRSPIMKVVLQLAALNIIMQTVSFLASPFDLAVSDAMGALKFVGFIIVVLCGYRLGQQCRTRPVVYLWTLGAIILMVEMVVAFCEILNFQYFIWLYASEKSKAIGQGLRVVGTLGNPNFFVWITTQATIMCLLGSAGLMRKSVFFLIGFAAVVVSGSKAALITFCAALFLVGVGMSAKGSVWARIGRLTLWLTLLGISGLALYIILQEHGDIFSYAAQIMPIFEGEDIQSVSSVSTRLSTWALAADIFWTTNCSYKVLLGLGPLDSFACLDNDILYVFFRYGLIGVVMSYGMWLRVLWVSYQHRSSVIACFLMQAIGTAMILGLQADTINGWNYSAWLGYFIGFMASGILAENPATVPSGAGPSGRSVRPEVAP